MVTRVPRLAQGEIRSIDDDAGTATEPFHGKAIHASPPEWFGGSLSADADPLGLNDLWA